MNDRQVSSALGGGRIALTYSQQDPSDWLGDASIGGSTAAF